MTALAGLQLGCDVAVLERNNYSPAANLASHSLVGDSDQPEGWRARR
jgi:phosphoribosylaminoimidazole carboxylase (NCAIR synthetase)